VGRIFISYVEEDSAIARQIAVALEKAGYPAWYYERDSVPGPSYLEQIARAMEQSQVVLLVVSPNSLKSRQVTSEVVRGHETGKPFLPVLCGLTHTQFQAIQPEWRGALGAATSIRIPDQGPGPILPRILDGVRALGISVDRAPATASPGGLRVRLQPLFDQTAYPAQEDPVARFLLELEVRPTGQRGVTADIFLVLDVSGSMDSPDRYPLMCRAVEKLLFGVEPDDRVGVVLFSTAADLVLEPTSGTRAASAIPDILRRMDASRIKFGGATCLSPGLRTAVDALAGLRQQDRGVQRVYVLTDGELHDTDECRQVLGDFRPHKVEIHAYGFGTQFDAAALKRLLSDQLGGSVKPICNEQDIVRTFAHVAEVNRRLVASEGMLYLEFPPTVVCGDAWTFRPQERHLGPVKGRRLVRELGGLEAGRVYSLLVEVRLPPDQQLSTPVARARLAWRVVNDPTEHTVEVKAPRLTQSGQGAAQPVPEVVRAYTVLDALRRQSDPAAQLAGLKSRLELALLEGRDPALVEALSREIERAEGKTLAPLSKEEERYLDADPGTVWPGYDRPTGKTSEHE
jgi:Mg-chelatase subunit ChlD